MGSLLLARARKLCTREVGVIGTAPEGSHSARVEGFVPGIVGALLAGARAFLSPTGIPAGVGKQRPYAGSAWHDPPRDHRGPNP